MTKQEKEQKDRVFRRVIFLRKDPKFLYQLEIKMLAYNFLSNHLDEIIDNIKNDEDSPDGLYDKIHEHISNTEAFSLVDSAYIVDLSNNPEWDNGLWEGQEVDKALDTQAFYTMKGDVYHLVSEGYEKMLEWFREIDLSDVQSVMSLHCEYDNWLGEFVNVSDVQAHDSEFIIERIGIMVMDEYSLDYNLEQVEKGSGREKELLLAWIKESHRDFRGGMPFGQSYIDMRSGVGFDDIDSFRFVTFDHELKLVLPHLKGLYSSDIEKYYQETFGEKPDIYW